MKYLLQPSIALRSWQLVPYAYYIKGVRNAHGLTREEYALLLRCDGEQEVEDSPLLQNLCQRNLCRPAEDNEKLTKWQKEKVYANRYFPAMNWMLTGRCNYNCRHCFNASDRHRLQSEFTWEEARALIDEAAQCGIHAFTITGGEPMMHPHFMEILRSIGERGMYVEEMNTNGFFLTKGILDEMRSIGCDPLIKISFDGIGHHDWMRNHSGAEEDALRAIRLCVENGFRVKVQTNVHRLNVDSMLSTAEILNELGVLEMRIIRTTESPRWKQNAGDACLTFEEYFDRMIEFSREYAKTEATMEVDIWQLLHLCPKRKTFRVQTIHSDEAHYRDSLPVCKGNRALIAVGANGNLYPCHQMSGYYEQQKWCLGNVKQDGLKKCLTTGPYLQTVCATVGELLKHNDQCAACSWRTYCCAGCRAIGLALTDDVWGEDRSKCLFFKNHYLEKVIDALPTYRSSGPLPGNLEK